ncbi:MAG: outer membrane lipoprotein-sorting protein [Sinomicrobium sp.]|nr:outer membrane lipoprotein-sorting protein [Sinomicrobium sp.]
MRTVKLFFIALAASAFLPLNAQTADEIIANFLENTGGKENWQKLSGFKFSAKLNMQGFELPLEVIQLKDGRQMSSAMFQGKEIKQGVYDGKTLWSINFMTMKPEASDTETTENFKLSINDFPDPFINYREKGYTIELMGKETIEGTETFKIKLVKEPVTVDGKKEDDISYYYFDTENFVPIVVESEVRSGPAKGMTQQTTLSDYQDVGGLYFAFSTKVSFKGQPGGQSISIQSVELNPVVDDALFKMPAEEAAAEDKK